MKRQSLGQQIRDVGPQAHASKAGTPTMGGVVILLCWSAIEIILAQRQGWPSYGGFVLASGLAFGGMGFVDDMIGLHKRRSTGLTGVQKILLGSLLSIGLYLLFVEQIQVPQQIPFSSVMITLPWIAGLLLTWILLLSSTNSTNLTDGLDGLATSIALLVLVGMLIGNPTADNIMLIVPLLGSLAGFLWLNTYPARLFLGDVGSFALGGIIGALALANGAAFLLPILAGVFVLEALSVMLQVSVLKLTGKRLLKMSPIHHHFEASETHGRPHWIPSTQWPESKVTARFVILQIGFVLLSIWALRLVR